MKCGDKIKAKPGTHTELFSEGTVGVIVELRNNWGGRNLVRWFDGEGIIFGFYPETVEVVG